MQSKLLLTSLSGGVFTLYYHCTISPNNLICMVRYFPLSCNVQMVGRLLPPPYQAFSLQQHDLLRRWVLCRYIQQRIVPLNSLVRNLFVLPRLWVFSYHTRWWGRIDSNYRHTDLPENQVCCWLSSISWKHFLRCCSEPTELLPHLKPGLTLC